MSYTNHTTNLELPQYIGTDKPTYLGDFNTAMQSIDAGYASNKTLAETANTNASSALSTANSASSDASSAISTANSASTLAGQADVKADTALNTSASANTKADTAITNASANATNIGNLTQLKTSVKTDIVNAINSLTHTVLYNQNNTSFSGQNITLNTTDYDFLIVFFNDISGVIIDKEDVNNVDVSKSSGNAGNRMTIVYRNLQIKDNGATLSVGSATRYDITQGGNINATTSVTDEIILRKIVGCKF